MFESKVYDPGELASLDDAALIDTITAMTRDGAAIEARRLAAIAEFTARRCGEQVHPDWFCDDWDNAAAELACALTLMHGRTMGLMDLGLALRDRLPRVAQVFLDGQISVATAQTIVRRTSLVADDEAAAAIDARLARTVTRWGPLSQDKLDKAIDAIVDRIDPDAVHRVRKNLHKRDITIGDHRLDGEGIVEIFGYLATTDAALLDATLTAMARGVCEEDPRTLGERRSAALGALSAHLDYLPCACENPDCAAKTGSLSPSPVTIHIVTNLQVPGQAGAKAQPDADTDGGPVGHAGVRPTALIPGRGGGFVPVEVLAEATRAGAKVRTVRNPGHAVEPRYRPSTALDEFVRTRDLTCRHPGCDRPAFSADIDHSRPHAEGGHTHPSSLNTRCRLHHLIKTFWPGWSETQHPDGSLTITTPTGHSYTSVPLSTIVFPDWNTTTGEPPPPRPDGRAGPGSTVMMPIRKRSRLKTRAQHIKAERAANATEAAINAAAAQAAAEKAARDDPPPF